MKKLRFLPIFLAIIILLTPVLSFGVLAVDAPEISSATAIVMDKETGEVIYSKNPDGLIYPASTTKIMTVLLAVEAIESGAVSIDDQVTASQNMSFDLISDGSSAGIRVGETMSLEDLLYCAMVSSANEACNVIAEYISGSVSAFVSLMNSRAAEMGCKGTNFVNTHGLPNDNHYTTASDMAIISLEAARHDLFMRICNTSSIVLEATNLSSERKLNNSNALICDDSIYGSKYVYEYAEGIKTGHTNAAGYCLISTAERDGVELLICVFGGSQSYDADGSLSYSNFADTITLCDWVFNNFSHHEILRSTENICSVTVEMAADNAELNLRPDTSLIALLPNDSDLSDFSRDIRIYSEESGEQLVAPITAGDVLGEVSVCKDGVNYGTVKLVAAASVDLSRMQYINNELSETFSSTGFKVLVAIVIVLVLAYLALVIIYRVRRIRHLMAVRAARIEKLRREQPEEQQPRPQRPTIDFFSQEAPSSGAAASHSAAPAPNKTETSQESQERDYFEEFFKGK